MSEEEMWMILRRLRHLPLAGTDVDEIEWSMQNEDPITVHGMPICP